MDLSKCYAIIILVLSLLYNYMWASLTSFKEANPQVITLNMYISASVLDEPKALRLQMMIKSAQMEMELLYTFLYVTSIIILLVFITPSLLSPIQVMPLLSQYFAYFH